MPIGSVVSSLILSVKVPFMSTSYARMVPLTSKLEAFQPRPARRQSKKREGVSNGKRKQTEALHSDASLLTVEPNDLHFVLYRAGRSIWCRVQSGHQQLK